MKRIAIFCDGTWNAADSPFPTNVHLLHGAVRTTGDDGVAQFSKYVPGVGTGFGMTGLRAKWDKISGGVFGVGVTRNITAAYRFLAETYESGDEIHIFGFSRGAFTARSLAGLLRASGLPDADQMDRIPVAIKRYRDMNRNTAPNTLESHKFRAGFSSSLATSKTEQAWRIRSGYPEPAILSVSYLGVWDTVGALGVPGHYRLLARIFNGNHGFHDLVLSRSVKAARHGVSIDEKRRTFPPTLWQNMGLLNQMDDDNRRLYQQHWFAGDHGSVGGGGDILGLSSIALGWIAAGATDQGLAFDTDMLAGFAREQEAVTTPLMNHTKPPGFVGRLLRKRVLHREGKYAPSFVWDVSEPAKRRWRATTEYRPRPLLHLSDDLDET
ncbi:DUF2235 domain-containing protein [Rhodobacteraceae bacterium]|nr:DUF2235 domain-containing protein [Paracoccaceae bacterium]